MALDTDTAEAVHHDFREATLEGLAALDADTCGHGNIHVRGTDGGAIHLRARVRAHAPTDAAARDLAACVIVSTAGGYVRVSGPPPRHREGWAVDMEFDVPQRTRLALRTRNGALGLEDFSGAASLDSNNGALILRRVTGDLRGRTVNGHVHVQLEGGHWDGAGLDVGTTNGGVMLAVPEGYSAQLDAHTRNGHIRVQIPGAVSGSDSRSSRRLSTTLGHGGATLRVKTINGNINITHG